MQRLRSERRLALPPILPLAEVSRSMSDVSLPAGDVSSCDDSSTESFWLSPKSSRNEDKYCLPTWSTAHPQSPASEVTSLSPIRSLSGTTSSLISNHPRRTTSILLLCGVTIMGLFAVLAPRVTLQQANDKIKTFHNHRDTLQRRLSDYERDIQDLERQLNTIDFNYNQQHLGFDATAAAAVVSSSESLPESFDTEERQQHEQNLMEMQELQQRLNYELAQAQHLKKLVQVTSRNATIEKFGYGNHYVELELIFPDNNDGPNTFIIEMAPIDIMPHSVNTFLEMVNLGLLNGCSFILNALQVVKAAPLPYDGTSASDKAKAFAQHGLESVAFKEYSPDYPHKIYTVGFAADGSPSFYINTADNSEIHVGDPCFGTVVTGYDTIHRLANSPTRNGIWFQHRIGIKSARIVPSSISAQKTA